VIFVSVAAFCDPWLVQTLRDACAKAADPRQLVFGVFEQDAEPREDELQAVVAEHGAALRYRSVHPAQSRGVCWARAAVGELYADEAYLLQIDSHMLFEPRWDELLLAQYAALRQRSARPIITVYPWGFEIEDGQPVVKIEPSTNTTLVMRPVPEAQMLPDNPTMMFRTEHAFVREPVAGCHVAGGFLFTSGDFVREVPYDPQLYFHGEEQSLALRAWTRGWDIWHPPHIPLYHLYKQPQTEHRAHHWHPEWEALRDFKQADLIAQAAARLADLHYERRDHGEYGLGTARSLADYARFAGIDYRARTFVQEYRADYSVPPPAEPPATEPPATAPTAPDTLAERVRRQAHANLAVAAANGNTQLNDALRLLAKWRSVLIQNTLLKHHGTVVIQGPLAGLDFLPQSSEGCHIAKLLGCYEQPLQPYIEQAIGAAYATILNIGCAEGYYAVGMARRMPHTRVLAFDLNAKVQQTCASLAARNGVADRVQVGGVFRPEDFAAHVTGTGQRVLVLCDIEGAERELLDPQVAPALRGMDLIVKANECLAAGTVQLLAERFATSHDILMVRDNGQRSLQQMPEWFLSLAHLDQLLATWEWRIGATPWLVMTARGALSPPAAP